MKSVQLIDVSNNEKVGHNSGKEENVYVTIYTRDISKMMVTQYKTIAVCGTDSVDKIENINLKYYRKYKKSH